MGEERSPMDRHTTTTLSPGRPSFWTLLVLVSVLAVLLLLATDALGVDPPASGDWDVTDDTTISGTDIVVTGNVHVRSGASLTLSDLVLSMNVSYHGQYNIQVERGGGLYMDGVTLDSLDRSTRFNLTMEGAAVIGNCVIRRMDGPQVPSPLSDPRGLVIESSSVRVHNSTITQCGGFAVTVTPGGLADVSPVLEDSVIQENGGGIYCGGVLIAKGNAIIRRCDFLSNGLGDVVVVAADPLVSDCEFTNPWYSWGVSGVTAIGLAEPTIVGCTFSFILAAINSVFADPTVRDCSITFCLAGVTVVGDDPLLDTVSITNCVAPLNLTSTFATVNDCTITGFDTLPYAVVIDGGKPVLNRLEVDLSLVGQPLYIFNDSRAVLRDCQLTGSGASPVVRVEDSMPTVEGCLVEGGTDGIQLVASPAIVEDCTISGNSGWGISSWFDAFTDRANTFGTGGDANGDGRVIQLYYLELLVALESGRPAVDATVTLIDALDDQVDEVATDSAGLAYEGVYVEFEVTNANRTITYAPYTAEAFLGELENITTFNISDNPTIVLVLRPPVDLPPVVEVLSPLDGGEYDVWQYGNRVPFEGLAVDPEGGGVAWAWYVDGELVNDEDLEFELQLAPGTIYEVALMGADEGGQETWVHHNFTVVSVPPKDNWVEVLEPGEDDQFDMGEVVPLVCEYYVLDHPEQEEPVELPVRWSSSIDGFLMEGAEGEVTNLTPGEHLLTASVHPRYTQFIPTPLTASVTIIVLEPEPLAHANISSPTEGARFEWDEEVSLSAEGSFIDAYDPPEYRTIYRWRSDLEGLLGEGDTLTVPGLDPGTHVITLLLTTDPFIVSDEATVTVVVGEEPNNAPVARITVLTAQPRAGEPVLMTARLSADPDGDALTYSWDLGDGNTSIELEVNHTYALGGNYTVRLTVLDGELEGLDQLVIEVAPEDEGGGGNGGGGDGSGGDGGDDGSLSTADTWLGWIFIVLLFAALGAMLVLWYRGRSSEQ